MTTKHCPPALAAKKLLTAALTFLQSEGFDVVEGTTLGEIQNQGFDSLDSIMLLKNLNPDARAWYDEWMTCHEDVPLRDYVAALCEIEQNRAP